MQQPKMGRTPCCPDEDLLLTKYIEAFGEGRWRTLPKKAGLQRCGKSCRLRWMNYLRPNVKRGYISPEEEDLILRLHRLLGNRWSLIAGRIPGRTDNEIKNYWNTHLSKQLISQGIDPRTHKPLDPAESQQEIHKAGHTSKDMSGTTQRSLQQQNTDHHPFQPETQLVPDQTALFRAASDSLEEGEMLPEFKRDPENSQDFHHFHAQKKHKDDNHAKEFIRTRSPQHALNFYEGEIMNSWKSLHTPTNETPFMSQDRFPFLPLALLASDRGRSQQISASSTSLNNLPTINTCNFETSEPGLVTPNSCSVPYWITAASVNTNFDVPSITASGSQPTHILGEYDPATNHSAVPFLISKNAILYEGNILSTVDQYADMRHHIVPNAETLMPATADTNRSMLIHGNTKSFLGSTIMGGTGEDTNADLFSLLFESFDRESSLNNNTTSTAPSASQNKQQRLEPETPNLNGDLWPLSFQTSQYHPYI